MDKHGDADPGDRPQGFMEEHCKTFIEQATWRPIPAIGQNYPHHTFCLGSAFDPTGNT
jgi:hypothetical protein